MEDLPYQLIFRAIATSFILMKVVLLLKLALFFRYKTSQWKAEHIVYFPSKDIFGSDEHEAKVKRTQNHLSILFIVLVLLVVVIETFA
jgi:hypothetical protein